MKLLSLALALSLPLALAAEVQLPHMLSDHAVLQRERPIHLWGAATPGAHLLAHFHDQTAAAVANGLGQWSLWLTPEAAAGPYTLTISGDGGNKVVSDLLVGDVWFASGQSNMEMPLNGFGPGTPVKDAEKEIAAANNPRLRLLLVQHKSSAYPLNDIADTWTECTPATARHFSAIAYFFGREIAAKQNVPVGLIDSTWGGTPADAWTSMETLGTDARLLPAFASRAQFQARVAENGATLAAERREDEAAKAAGKPLPSHPWHPDEVAWQPAALYNGMVAPFTPLSIRGFLWYQGEANTGLDRAPFYASLFPAMIGDWRTHFAQGDLPFLFVQISSFSSPSEDWGLVRDAQRRTLSVAGTAMAVTLDIGLAHNVHPPDKQTVATRLARSALSMVYGESDGADVSSPLFRQVTTEFKADGSRALRVWFDHGQGLSYRGEPATGFELAGADGKFVPAQAQVERGAVLVSSPAVPEPVVVRYGWMGVMDSNLFNESSLPASTFTSEPHPTR